MSSSQTKYEDVPLEEEPPPPYCTATAGQSSTQAAQNNGYMPQATPQAAPQDPGYTPLRQRSTPPQSHRNTHTDDTYVPFC